MKKWIRNSALLALGMATLVYGGFDGKRVQSISVRAKDPSASIDSEAILRRLQSHEGGTFSQDKFDQDLKILSKDYDDVQPRLTESSGEIQITLVLSSRPIIHSIIWRGNHNLGSGSLGKELGIEQDTLLDKAKLNDGISKIRQYYLKKGYFQARVRYNLEFESSDRARLIIEIEEGSSGEIRKINYNGIDKADLKKIQDELVLREYNFFTSWYTGRGQYIENAMELDRNRLIHQLQDDGYADALVKNSVQDAPRHKGVILSFDALRGQVYHIRHLSLEGCREEYREKLLKLINLKEGDCYSPGKLRKVVEKVTDYYGSKGYCDALINYEPTLVSVGDQLYDVILRIKEGSVYHVGMVRFSGNYITKPRVITHESLMIPGELVSTRKLEATERRLMNTGYFKSVHIRTVDSAPEGFPDGDYKDVVIEVEESDSTTKFSFKLGASLQEGAYGGVSASFDNFYLKGIPRLFKDGMSAIRGNGEHLALDTSFSKHWTEYELSWTDPYFLETPWSFGIDLDRRVQRFVSGEDYSSRSQGITFLGYYPINNFLRLKLSQSFREESIKLSDKLRQDSDATEAIHNGLYVTQGIALMYDSTNRINLASRGFRSTLALSTTEGPCAYAKLSYHNGYYWSPKLLEEGTFKIHLDLDALSPLLNSQNKDIPLSQRLMLGGDDLRGYQNASLGKRDTKGNALGGITRGLYGVQYLYRINTMLSVFTFSDNGFVSDKYRRLARNYHSVGWGVRIELMNKFPIMFGLAYPLTGRDPQHLDHPITGSDRRAIERRFFFSLGGKF